MPTDFSAGAKRAVEHAVAVARQCGASLTLLHVIDVNALADRDHTGPAAEFMKQVWAEGFDRMAQLAWSLSGQVDAQASVHEGLPWEEIAARSRDFDLVILGQSERRSGWRPFSRHTTQRVFENAACPVMTVPIES